MNRRIVALTLGLSTAVLFAPGFAFAEDHLAEAITHTKQAIEHGEMGHPDVLVTHAEAAEKAKANPHTKQGITHLEAANSKGKKKDDKAAAKHAEEALTQLEAATK